MKDDSPFDLDADFSVSKISITKKGKRQIEDLLAEHCNKSISSYCDDVDIKSPNFYAVLSGTRQCTLEFLNKMLSGIGYQVSIEMRLIVHPVDVGEPAPPVDYIEHGTELQSNGEEEPDTFDCYS